jgi:pimeloyl-ACP methyl ester carboxylesterase
MMPFSVLRIWIGGLFSWLVIGVAVYCLWEAAERMQTPREVRVEERQDRQPNVGDQEEPLRADGRQREIKRPAWPYLAAGLGLLGYSLIGFLPVSLLLGRPGRRVSASKANCRDLDVDRPDGSKLRVKIFGNLQGPTLVFTHGWSLEGSVWDEVAAKLEERFRIIVWDLPGLGQSRGPANGDFRLEKMADDLAAVVQATDCRQAILVSHSIGGMITQTFCRLHPQMLNQQVAGIVLLHTTYTNPLNTAFGRTLWKTIEKPVIVPLCHLTIWLAPLAWLSNWQSFLNGNLHLSTRLSSFSGRQTWSHLHEAAWLAAKAWPGVVGRGNLAMLSFDEQQTLPKIDSPVLVVAAQHDRMTCPDASDRLATLLPHSLETAVRAGHLSFYEQPGDVAQLVTELAEQLGQSPPTGQPVKRWHADATLSGGA